MDKKKVSFKGREIEVRTFTYGDYFALKARGEVINADTALYQVLSLEDREFLHEQELDVSLAKEFANLGKAFSEVNPKLNAPAEKDDFLGPKSTSSGETKSG